jgi:hypothetical protein
MRLMFRNSGLQNCYHKSVVIKHFIGVFTIKVSTNKEKSTNKKCSHLF